MPTDEIISNMEQGMQIENDEVAVTDSFADYGYETSGPMHNLQVALLIFLFLLFFPLLSFLMKYLFFWSIRCANLVNRINRMIMFNTYARIGLETYLELSIVALLRLKQFNFDSYNEIYHSVFAGAILFLIVAYMLFSLAFLQARFKNLALPEYQERIGDLYLGIRVGDRYALLFPFFFMLRRILYAALLVNWSERNYF